MSGDHAYGRTREDVLEQYAGGTPHSGPRSKPKSPRKGAPKKGRGTSAKCKCPGRGKRAVWSVAYVLPPRVARAHVTHTTASDARAAKRDVLRHLPEGTRVEEAEPTRRVRREPTRETAPRSRQQERKPRAKRGKRTVQHETDQAAA